MLRKLATAIESNQLTSPGEASRIAQDIEAKAFAAANCETDYQQGIAHHLAQIFSQSKSGPDSESPDSTTWQEPPSGQPAHSSPDSSGGKTAEGPHFPSDTTLNCFQVLKGLLNVILNCHCDLLDLWNRWPVVHDSDPQLKCSATLSNTFTFELIKLISRDRKISLDRFSAKYRAK